MFKVKSDCKQPTFFYFKFWNETTHWGLQTRTLKEYLGARKLNQKFDLRIFEIGTGIKCQECQALV